MNYIELIFLFFSWAWFEQPTPLIIAFIMTSTFIDTLLSCRQYLVEVTDYTITRGDDEKIEESSIEDTKGAVRSHKSK